MSLEAVRAKGLLVDRAWIGGQWCEADSGRRFPVFDPASGDRLAEVPDMGEAETRRAIAAAAAAFDSWRRSLPQERAVVLSRWAALMRSSLEELATLVMHEQGKPLAQARGEVAHAAAFVEWFAEEGKRIYGEIMPTNRADRRFLVLRQPVGVCAAITPWNFPASMITRKVAPALAVGCTVVVKPAEQTPLTALALARLAEQA
ncbi:MAG: aldehyde dehydrogenase family protein, partial [Tepidiphilus sp.]|nr:aldehyde dehydrogenase family protein [Tepidiphilus sp.]